jgi:glycosyltransferase involved in cell wall biosynthesis
MKLQRVGFVLCSSVEQPIPSTRIAILNVLPLLEAAGIRSTILFAPPQPSETPDLCGVVERAVEAACDVVVLQKVHGEQAVELAQNLAARGIRSVFSVCDLVDVPMVQATDATVCVTHYLRSLYPADLQSRIHVVHDGIERPAERKTAWNAARGTRLKPLRAVVVTSARLDKMPVEMEIPAWLSVRLVGRYSQGLRWLREARWCWAKQSPQERRDYLRFLADTRIVCVPWTQDGVYRELNQADIAFIPVNRSIPVTQQNIPAWATKSENRLTLMMAMGLPVIATPIPAYEDVLVHGVNGFFARSSEDWRTCLAALRDGELRREMGMKARDSVIRKFSVQEQAGKLLGVLEQVCALRSAPRAVRPESPAGISAFCQLG